jgi:hypothetical protein
MPSPAQILHLQIPNSVDTTQLKVFLQSQEISSYDLLWAYSPTDAVPNVGFRFIRSAKEPGSYYREPYPLTVSVKASELPALPVVPLPLEIQDVQELLNLLQ